MGPSDTKESSILKLCTSHEEKDGLKIYELKATEEIDHENRIRVLDIGNKNKYSFKTVILLGETGDGKSTFANSCINHMFDVDFNDHYRLRLKDRVDQSRRQTQSQTEYTSVYKIYHQPGMRYQNNFMIIDTPGFGDTVRSPEDKDFVMNTLNALFLGKFGVDNLHVIGVVAKASRNREVMDFKKMVKNTALLLGVDCSIVTHVLCTFAYDETPVVEVIKNCGLIFAKVYEFENSPLYSTKHLSSNASENTLLRLKNRWEEMQERLSVFFGNLDLAPSVSVKRTRLLHENKKKLGDLEKELGKRAQNLSLIRKKINDKKLAMNETKERAEEIDWKEIVPTKKRETKDVENGFHAHYCRKCDKTCGPSCKEFSHATNLLLLPMAAIAAVGGVASAALLAEEPDPGKTILSVLDTTTHLAKSLSGSAKEFSDSSYRCPLNSHEKCGIEECDHVLSEHEKSWEKITKIDTIKEVIDEEQKQIFDELMVELEATKSEIKQLTEECAKEEENSSEIIIKLVKTAQRVSRLSLGPVDVNPEASVDKLQSTSRDTFYFQVLLEFREEIKEKQKVLAQNMDSETDEE